MGNVNAPAATSCPVSKFVWTILLVATTAVWGWSFVVIQDAIAVAGVTVTGFLAVRFVLASACMAPFCAPKMTRRTVKVGAGVGLFLAAGFLFQTAGLRYTSPTNSGLITGLALILAPAAARFLFGVRPPRATVICLGACLVGLAMLTGPSPAEFRLGDLLTVGCAVAFGLHIALLSRYAPEHDAGAMALVQVCVCAAVCLIAWAVFETPAWPPAGNWPAGVWWALLLTGVVGAAAAFYIQTRVQQRLSAARTSVVLTMEPVFAAFFGYWLAGDRLGPVQLAGGAIILASLLIAELSAARREAR
jgi:drug/metabolite transporter (DMT)-like permease